MAHDQNEQGVELKELPRLLFNKTWTMGVADSGRRRPLT